MKLGLQNVTAGNSISLMGPKFVSTFMRVGFDLYRIKNVAINAVAHRKQNTGVNPQKTRVNVLPRGSLTCLTPDEAATIRISIKLCPTLPWMVAVDENWSQVVDKARLKTLSFFSGLNWAVRLAIAIVHTNFPQSTAGKLGNVLVSAKHFLSSAA